MKSYFVGVDGESVMGNLVVQAGCRGQARRQANEYLAEAYGPDVLAGNVERITPVDGDTTCRVVHASVVRF